MAGTVTAGRNPPHEIEQFDHYKDQAVLLPAGSFIEVEGDVYRTTSTGRGYSTKHQSYLPELIWRYDFNIIKTMGRRKSVHKIPGRPRP